MARENQGLEVKMAKLRHNVVDRLMCQFLDEDVRRQITDVNVQDHKDELCSCGYGSITTGSVTMTDGNRYDFHAVGRCLSPGVYDDSFKLLNFPNQSPDEAEINDILEQIRELRLNSWHQ